MLGLSCRKIANLNPTRESTWQLCKRAMYITALQILILIIRLFGAFIAMSMVIQQWESKSNLEAGNYEIINKETKEVFRYYKPRSSSSKGAMIEKEEKDQAGAFFFMSIFASFAIACCCLSICCACTIGGLYKFHITTKELELIQDLPSVRDINLNRQVASGVPVYQYRPDPSTSIARGQVLMVPNIQS